MKKMLLGLLIALATAAPQLQAIVFRNGGIETTNGFLKMEDLIGLPERVNRLERLVILSAGVIAYTHWDAIKAQSKALWNKVVHLTQTTNESK